MYLRFKKHYFLHGINEVHKRIVKQLALVYDESAAGASAVPNSVTAGMTAQPSLRCAMWDDHEKEMLSERNIQQSQSDSQDPDGNREL